MDSLIEYCKQKKYFPSNLLYKLLNDGNMEHIETLIDNYSYSDINYCDILDYNKVIMNACKSENGELFDYIIRLIGIRVVNFETFQSLLIHKNAYISDFLRISCENYDTYDTIIEICDYDKIDLLDIATEKFRHRKINYKEIISRGPYSDNLDFVKYLHEKYLDQHINCDDIFDCYTMKENIFYSVCKSSNIDIINYIYNKYDFEDDMYTNFHFEMNPLEYNLNFGNYECVEHIIQLFPKMNFDYINVCLFKLCHNKYSSIDIFEYMVNKYGNRLDFYKKYSNYGMCGNSLTIACKYGNIENVKYILDNHPNKDIDKYFHEMLMNSCQSGNIELIDYLYNRFPQIATSLSNNDHLCEIFNNINLKVAKFLVTNFPEIYLEKFIKYINEIPFFKGNKKVHKWTINACIMSERKIKCTNF